MAMCPAPTRLRVLNSCEHHTSRASAPLAGAFAP
eukprot:CAMPEP_0202109686 /NCGR_PEP_ID=MMETSP0965-20130614/24481_1 /ASSEMBLY_ACC=CAM_ASM_000507 /TAXON_ID=4773 /ORGANISM="Schizochytrium aggregatum, Strain ATCC28209" /LENGTH=33 /DNA_ID= /DNA_START= /DNA_END= /DNA_ORIENTATION=